MIRRIMAVPSALLLVIPLLAAAQDGSPDAVVERFQNELLAVMKSAERLDYQGRYERLAPAVRESHDLAAIAQLSVGSYWDGLSEEKQATLVNAFAKLSIATYADRFDGYSGETFEVQSSEKLSAEVAGVHSELRQPNGKTFRFDYLMRRSRNGWRIVNIVVDGVSDLALKRSEYASILGDQGFDALIERIKAKIADYSQPPAS